MRMLMTVVVALAIAVAVGNSAAAQSNEQYRTLPVAPKNDEVEKLRRLNPDIKKYETPKLDADSEVFQRSQAERVRKCGGVRASCAQGYTCESVKRQGENIHYTCNLSWPSQAEDQSCSTGFRLIDKGGDSYACRYDT